MPAAKSLVCTSLPFTLLLTHANFLQAMRCQAGGGTAECPHNELNARPFLPHFHYARRQCAAKLEAGQLDQPGGMMSDEALEKGFALTCVAYPLSDCKMRCIPEVGAGCGIPVKGVFGGLLVCVWPTPSATAMCAAFSR